MNLGEREPSIEDDLRLDDFLGELGLERNWVVGLFAAILSGPEQIAPNAWIPELVSKATFADAAAASTGFELIMGLYNDVGTKLASSPKELCPPSDDIDATNAFCSGYVHGAKMHAAWKRDEAAFVLVFVFAAIAGEVEDDFLRGEGDEPPPDPDAWRQKHRERIADYVTELRDYWKVAKPPVRRAESKVGRNDACPCGSGKKHKKCCMK